MFDNISEGPLLFIVEQKSKITLLTLLLTSNSLL